MGTEDKEELKNETGTEGEESEESKTNPEDKKPEGEESEEDVKDSHGQPGINRERHEKEMAAKDAEIAKLKAEIAKAAETKEGREKLEKGIAELEEAQADERVNHKLEMAGCKNLKAAKALLEDYGGDVSKLKTECPYLFEEEKQRGKTGGKPAGSVGKTMDDKIEAAFGMKKG